MPPDCLPALNLPRILPRNSTAHVIATIPLKPSARIIGIYPSFLPPGRKRLTRADAKVIQRAVASGRRKPGACEPALRKFFAAVRHVFTAEYTEGKHLLRGKFGPKFWIEIASDRLRENVAVPPLHLVVDCNLYISSAHNCMCNALCWPEEIEDNNFGTIIPCRQMERQNRAA